MQSKTVVALSSSSANRPIMHLSLIVILIRVSLMFAAIADASNNEIYPLSHKLSKNDRDIIENNLTGNYLTDRYTIFSEHPKLILHALERYYDKVLTKTDASSVSLNGIYIGITLWLARHKVGIYDAIVDDKLELLKYYCDHANKWSVNWNKEFSVFYSVNFTPLVLAIIKNRYHHAKMIVETNNSPREKVSLHFQVDGIWTRDFARQIKDKNDRRKMLRLLRFNPQNHDDTFIRTVLKDYPEITVKEAVMTSLVDVIEAALLIGNFGDMNDVSVWRHAVDSNNLRIVRIIMLEGYAVPPRNSWPNMPDSVKNIVEEYIN